MASQLHAGQLRKASIVPDIPYLSHLMEVAGMVMTCGFPETVVVAALFHDLIEDQGSETRDLIREHFGEEVLALVEACTEPGAEGAKKGPWVKRKEAYLERIGHDTLEVLGIIVPDKLQSAREQRRKVRLVGDEAWHELLKEVSDLPQKIALQKWFHTAFVQAVKDQLYIVPHAPQKVAVQALLQELEETVATLFPS
ncbi:hypothetical protein KSF_107560 [Reticulibacter mediterranei]|uniref:HD/PDEase domain-containing protein n=2 Tax=Reticulibacter mediterranei TaxID=2778369 RepID=A0A8J3IYA1_9CHLR|nr:hypothetical protein KSF_107560 [Reticulibacter mediterranei]